MIVGDLVDAGVAEIRTGPFGTQLKASDYVESGRPVLNVRNVGFGDVRTEKLEYIDERTADRLSGHLLQSGDIVFGRKGAVERHAFITDDFVGALQGSDCIRLRLSEGAPIRAHFASFALRTTQHQAWMQAFCSHGATMASLNQDILRQIQLPDLPLAAQDAVIEVLGSIDDLIENNRRRVEVLEEIARTVYREWFVRFQYPGHENVPLVDSALGLIPDGWAVKRVRELGATGAGPFGSKLGRKDYVTDGVPVLRGTNLRVGGGFDESDFVYVTSEKAEELRSSIASRGDLVITQRGTLGQIALIPETSDHERYVLSQSQMKLTAHHDAASAEFVYRQMSTAEVTARFIAQAMSSGVPHVNLTLLREFEILAPPSDLQHRFGDIVRGLDQEASALRAQARTLGALRDLLLPRLVTGQIDVSQLDLDALTGAATA